MRVLFLILIFSVGLLSAQSTIEPSFEASLDKSVYQAGDRATLTIKISNINNDKWYMEDLKVSIKSNAIISYEPTTQGPVTLDMNESKTFRFNFRLKNFPNGQYDMTVSYSSRYICAGTPVRMQLGEKTLKIKIDNSEPSLSLFKTDYLVKEGESFTLVFLNEGVIARNASFQISSDASFFYDGSLGHMVGTTPVKVAIKEKKGTYKAYVNLTYFNKLGEERKISVPINIRVEEKGNAETRNPPPLLRKITNPEKKATFGDYLPYYAFGLFLILLFAFLIMLIVRMP